MINRQAYWCDVCPLPTGGFAWVYVIGEGDPNTWNKVVCEVEGEIKWITSCSSTPRYLRCASDNDGKVTAVGQGQNGEGLLVIRESGCMNWVNVCFGPPAIRWNGGNFDIFVQENNSYYFKVSETPNGLNISELLKIPIWPGGNGTTPNGWTQVSSPDYSREELRWSDEYYSRTIQGNTFLLTTEFGSITVGQLGGIAGGIPTNGGTPFVALNAPAMNPRLAWDKVNNIYAVCSWTTSNQAYYNELPPYVPIPEPEYIITPINRPVLFGFFTFNSGSVSRPSNCDLFTGDRMYLKHRDGTIICRYIAASSDSNLDELNELTRQAQKEEPHIPVGAYWTEQCQKIGIPIAPIKFLEAYWKTWETEQVFEKRIRDNSVRAGKSILVGQCYTSNTSNVSNLKSLPPIYSRILRDINGGIVLFNDGQRSGNDHYGWPFHPEVHGLYQEMFDTIPK